MRILAPGLLAAAAAAAVPAQAQDLSLMAGETRTRSPDAHSFGLGLVYAHDLAPHLEASLSYRNEGHVPGHHRDGHAAQLWAKTQAFFPELWLAAGAGPYHYFDTAIAEANSGQDYSNAHGWGAIYGVTATWRPRESRWFYQLRVEHVEAQGSLDTTMFLGVIGYRLEQDPTFGAAPPSSRTDDEVFLGLGKTIVNSFQSESNNAPAGTLSWRRTFGPVLRTSVAWIHESDARLIRRDGLALQAWVEPSFGDGRFTLGLGLGAYAAADHYHPEEKDVMALVGTTASWRIAERWVTRIEWQRVASRNDRDSDIVLLGVGYRF
jgi:hypothetical protein